MAITMGMLMLEAKQIGDKKAMQAISHAYNHWFSKHEKQLTERTNERWNNTPVLEILKEEISV